MTEIRVELGERSYKIYIETGLIDKSGFLLPKGKKIVFITDSNVGPLYAERARYSATKADYDVKLITVPAGEEHKNRQTLENIYDKLFEYGADRSTMIVALGGGVIGDMAGFAAATFMRGVPYVQMPTTLLAAVDSSVGGKTGINHPRGKNMIGSFYQPSMVIADPATLRTLPEREVSAGMAEVIKYGVIRDAAFFQYLEDSADSIKNLEAETIEHVISVCCRIKANVVEADEREGGVRAILNYGHTLGHALEAVTDYSKYCHGEAVSIGMNLAAKIAKSVGLVDQKFIDRQNSLLQRFDLPIDPPENVDVDKLIEVLHSDKKVRDGRLRFILPVGMGSVVVTEEVTEEHIRALF